MELKKENEYFGSHTTSLTKMGINKHALLLVISF
jgi:hypothetical protein